MINVNLGLSSAAPQGEVIVIPSVVLSKNLTKCLNGHLLLPSSEGVGSKPVVLQVLDELARVEPPSTNSQGIEDGWIRRVSLGSPWVLSQTPSRPSVR